MVDNTENQQEGVRASEKRPLDWVSVGLSGIAAILIAIGIYFLSQSITMSTNKSSNSSSESSVSVSSSSSAQSSVSTSSVSVSSVSTSSAASSFSSVSSSVSTSVFDPSTAPLKIGSTNAEIIIKLDGVTETDVAGAVEQTGFTNTRWFRAAGIRWNNFDAAKFNPLPQVGERWRLELIITASQENGAIAAPGAITIVKAYKL